MLTEKFRGFEIENLKLYKLIMRYIDIVILLKLQLDEKI